MIPKRIAILGDSWAHGEWSVLCNYDTSRSMVTHTGLQHYLRREWDHIDIVNFGISGGGNLYQLDRINELLGGEGSISKVFDLLICFWTNPGRDVVKNFHDDCGEIILPKEYKIEDYEKECNIVNNHHCRALDSLGIPVILIGGQVSLPTLPPRTENLIPLVPRMANLVPDPLWDIDKVTSIEGNLTNILEHNQLRVIPSKFYNEKFLEDLNQKSKEEHYNLNYKYFNDLGHGNRILHKMVADLVIKTIEEWK